MSGGVCPGEGRIGNLQTFPSNEVQLGSISLSFDRSHLDFVYKNPFTPPTPTVGFLRAALKWDSNPRLLGCETGTDPLSYPPFLKRP